MVGLLDRLGLAHIRERGEEVWAECPSHHDSGDSWSINKANGMHRCFACGYRGHVQLLVMDTLDVDNFEANRLIRSFGLNDTIDIDRLAEARDAGPVPERRVLPHTARFSTFPTPPEAEIQHRHLDVDTIMRFGIRWNPRTDSWVLPIRTPGGELLGWQEKAGKSVRNRPPGIVKSKTVFGAELLEPARKVVLVESPLDAAYLSSIGYQAFASFGAGVSDDQMRLLTDYADEIVLALDNDAAGEENTARLAAGYSFNQKGQIIPGIRWAARAPLWVINYRPDSPKDVGEMEVDQVVWAIEDAVHILDWLPTAKRENSDVSRSTARVPAGRIRANGGTGRHSRRLRDGPRQDPHNHRLR
jgi:DNA primase